MTLVLVGVVTEHRTVGNKAARVTFCNPQSQLRLKSEPVLRRQSESHSPVAGDFLLGRPLLYDPRPKEAVPSPSNNGSKKMFHCLKFII